MVEFQSFITPVWPVLVRVFAAANVPVTSFKIKFALNLPSGASVYLNPCFVILTLSAAPISFVSAVRSAFNPLAVFPSSVFEPAVNAPVKS